MNEEKIIQHIVEARESLELIIYIALAGQGVILATLLYFATRVFWAAAKPSRRW